MLPDPEHLDVVARAVTSAAYSPRGLDAGQRAEADAALAALHAVPRERARGTSERR